MSNKAAKNRIRRKRRIRKKISGTADRPRLSVSRSVRHIFAQVIDDKKGCTLAASSSIKVAAGDGNKTEAAKAVGESIAKLCAEKGIEKVVFDRNGFLYHGRVRALAEAAREAGLTF